MPKAQVPADELETLIVQEVRRHKHCGDFQSVELRLTTGSPGINWDTGTPHYGNASPELCDDALGSIIPRMQRDYDLRLEKVGSEFDSDGNVKRS